MQVPGGFEIGVASGETFHAKKLIFAAGIKDQMPDIPGFAACWGISVLHCPYCHGYEVRDQKTGILGNGDLTGFDFPILISNWTKELTIYTNGPSTLTPEQTEKLKNRGIQITADEIEQIEHSNGQVRNLVFKNGTKAELNVLYGPRPFQQSSLIPETLGCELTEDGYIKTDAFQKTSIPGVYACGDGASRIRTVANAVSTGAFAGMMLNKDLSFEEF
jgi:thioredoxin reductase